MEKLICLILLVGHMKNSQNDVKPILDLNQGFFWALEFFGGRDIYDLAASTKIFFANGKLDPWSAGGLKHTLTDALPSYLIEGSAHHLDLRFPNELDPPDVTWARTLEKFYVEEWITDKLEYVEEYSANKKAVKS